MTTIGIVGAGIAALHLALRLQKNGVEATIYADRPLDALRGGRLPNGVALMGATLARDRELGTDHWSEPELLTHSMNLRVAGDPPLVIQGTMTAPWLFIDMRLYLPRLMEDFVARGGKVVVGPCGEGDVASLAAAHDLVVIATGRAGLIEMFPRMAERSPYDVPQRRIRAGLYRGVHFPRPAAFNYNMLPGNGEVFEGFYNTRGGQVAMIAINAIPGGALEPVARLRHEDDPAAFNAAILATLREHAPDTYARADPATFGLTSELDTLSGAIVPTVRRGWAALPGGRFVLAVGDTHVTHDPITGQGANAASRAAWLLADRILSRAQEGGPFDGPFCVDTEERLWGTVRATAEWTNAFLQPPPPHAIGLLVAASQNRALADAFASNFNDPDRQWAVLSSPDATAAFIASFAPPPVR
jgi:hypothetical protein